MVILAGVSLLLLAIAALSFVRTYSRVAEPASFRSFNVSGEGKAVGIPDIATFNFQVITEGGKDVAALQKENTDKVNAAIAYLKDQKVDEKDIKTQSYSLDPRYSYCSGNRACPPPEITGFTIRQMVEVKVRDMGNVGKLMSGVISKGANSTNGPVFSIDDPTKVQNEARAEAIAKAKAKAEDLANAGGFKLGRLLSIEEGISSAPQPLYAYGMGGAGVSMKSVDQAIPTIQPGSQDVNVTVSLKYEID